MTGPEHYAKAEEHLTLAATIETDGHDDSMSAWHQRQAQVHATLALAAATALPHAGELPVADHDAWWAAAGSEPVWRDRGEVTR
jgi:hypothetical protein